MSLGTIAALEWAFKPPFSAVSHPLAAGPVIEEALPEYGNNPPIAFAKSVRQKGYEGTVALEVLVKREGRFEDLKILASSRFAIPGRSALKSVKAWSFKPAKRGNGPIEMRVQVPVHFKIE
jgi:protein TonB